MVGKTLKLLKVVSQCENKFMCNLIYLVSSVPGPVVQFVTDSVSFTLAKLTWTQPEEINGVLTSYVLTVYSNDEEIQRHNSIDRNSQKYTVTNLRPATEYRFSIRATTIAGEGPTINSSTITLSLGWITDLFFVHQ